MGSVGAATVVKQPVKVRQGRLPLCQNRRVVTGKNLFHGDDHCRHGFALVHIVATGASCSAEQLVVWRGTLERWQPRFNLAIMWVSWLMLRALVGPLAQG